MSSNRKGKQMGSQEARQKRESEKGGATEPVQRETPKILQEERGADKNRSLELRKGLEKKGLKDDSERRRAGGQGAGRQGVARGEPRDRKEPGGKVPGGRGGRGGRRSRGGTWRPRRRGDAQPGAGGSQSQPGSSSLAPQPPPRPAARAHHGPGEFRARGRGAQDDGAGARSTPAAPLPRYDPRAGAVAPAPPHPVVARAPRPLGRPPPRPRGPRGLRPTRKRRLRPPGRPPPPLHTPTSAVRPRDSSAAAPSDSNTASRPLPTRLALRFLGLQRPHRGVLTSCRGLAPPPSTPPPRAANRRHELDLQAHTSKASLNIPFSAQDGNDSQTWRLAPHWTPDIWHSGPTSPDQKPLGLFMCFGIQDFSDFQKRTWYIFHRGHLTLSTLSSTWK
ncbi:basic proline-rich protein-like [Hippopotamus amphibius kiboko]|uniref:basic proline-rich protein-like n=1 Tax=Hippopotamus amphibius kiboko TaxID=575201 RepID=UPI00259932B9|nr:basic proline-rich protein-like [Hippopotamus amphibius kiboko]